MAYPDRRSSIFHVGALTRVYRLERGRGSFHFSVRCSLGWFSGRQQIVYHVLLFMSSLCVNLGDGISSALARVCKIALRTSSRFASKKKVLPMAILARVAFASSHSIPFCCRGCLLRILAVYQNGQGCRKVGSGEHPRPARSFSLAVCVLAERRRGLWCAAESADPQPSAPKK